MAIRHPLRVAFVWHMHQPFYKDLATGEYMLPWVRLHAIKDYYDMLAYLDNFPKIRAVFNIVPSLFIQIEDYVNGTAKDKFLELSLRAPEDLELEEKIFLLKNFFLANWENMIKPYPRYYDLLLKRGRFVNEAELHKIAKRFTNQEITDLQVWFNLTWFGQVQKENDKVISELIKKGSHFNESEKRLVIDKQIDLMKLIIPKYKQMQDDKRIEISVTPFYHPILPLLCDTNVALEANKYAKLPRNRFKHPEDADIQIKSAVEYYLQKFGCQPVGMWPSEGSVSEEIIPIIASSQIKWIATDEGILEKSLGRKLSAQDLFVPYYFEKDGKGVNIIFRDRKLSDDIGFIYARWNPVDAANDLVAKLKHIANILPDDNKNYLVSIILDGENAWEYYIKNGKPFFESLYSILSNDKTIETVTIKDFLQENTNTNKLSRLHAGSWINSNFDIWIGHEEDNLSWDYLYKARELLSSLENPPSQAWQEIYIAEGSDWNWWYGDEHSSANDEDFDKLYRKHLKNVYEFAGREAPKYLDLPIRKVKKIKPQRDPVYFIYPILDGEVSNYYEWLSAGLFSVEQMRGAMHQSETLIKNIYYGFNKQKLFFRIDPSMYLSCEEEEFIGLSFEIHIIKPVQKKIELKCTKEKIPQLFLYSFQSNEKWIKTKQLDSFAIGRIIEIGIDFSDLEIKENDEVQFIVSVKKDNKEIESWPKGGVIYFKAPDEDFETINWMV